MSHVFLIINEILSLFCLIVQLIALELLSEKVVSLMEEKSKNIKRARTIRSDYNSYVDAVQKWLQEVEVKVQDRVVEPVLLKQSVQVCEILINPKTHKIGQ